MNDPADETKQTVNEQRAERGLPPLPGGNDITVGQLHAGIRDLAANGGANGEPYSPLKPAPIINTSGANAAPTRGTWTIRIDRGLLDRLMETGRLDIPSAAGKFAIELRDGPVQNLLNAELVEAVRALYYAAWWTPDRKCDAAALWEGVRDAARITPGEAPRRKRAMRRAIHDYRDQEYYDALGRIKDAAAPAAKKRIEDLSDDELVAEWREWDKKITDAESWGGGIVAADEFRRECARELERRGIVV